MTTLTKPCARCKESKAFSEFYVRSGISNPTEAGHYLSECKTCMKGRNKETGYIHPTMPRTKTEILALDALKANNIAALPGKAVHSAHVDIVAMGCVDIEVKYAKLRRHGGAENFVFNSTKQQMQRGFLAQVVILICDYGDRLTYHLFDATDEVFYMYGRIKSGFVFTPGQFEQVKHMQNRVKLTQPIMDEHENQWNLIWKHVRKHVEMLPNI